MKFLYFTLLIIMSLSGCKKDKLGNKGACENSFYDSNATVVIEDSENNTFCLLPNLNYHISLVNLNLHAIDWNTGDTTDLITVDELGLYNGSGVNDNNDTIVFSFEAKNCNNEVYIPTDFTPNGDGLNDEWGIVFLKGFVCYEDFDLTIFNNSRQLVFKDSEISATWNGEQTGLPAPLGLYHFIANYKEKNGDMKEVTSQFLLIR